MQPQGTAVTPPRVATLVAITEEATHALGGRSGVPVTTFPFRVGRERRVGPPAYPTSGELRLGVESPLNDFYLPDPARKHLHISAKHFAVEYVDETFFLRDRGSACGTIVAGQRIGGKRKGGRIKLRSGDEIVIGTDTSPYVFRFEVAGN
jgi:pSer/pThr/pTyr-binding forkhead associated (FHA) protein